MTTSDCAQTLGALLILRYYYCCTYIFMNKNSERQQPLQYEKLLPVLDFLDPVEVGKPCLFLAHHDSYSTTSDGLYGREPVAHCAVVVIPICCRAISYLPLMVLHCYYYTVLDL